MRTTLLQKKHIQRKRICLFHRFFYESKAACSWRQRKYNKTMFQGIIIVWQHSTFTMDLVLLL